MLPMHHIVYYFHFCIALCTVLIGYLVFGPVLPVSCWYLVTVVGT